MISRSTILALVFACFATLSLAGAAEVQRTRGAEVALPAAMPVYQMPRVVVVGKARRSTEEAPSGN